MNIYAMALELAANIACQDDSTILVLHAASEIIAKLEMENGQLYWRRSLGYIRYRTGRLSELPEAGLTCLCL